MSQQQLVEIISAIYRDTRRPATTLAIASRAYVSDRTALRWLNRFEGQAVRRVGKRRGWELLSS